MKIKLKPIRQQVAVVFGASSGIGRDTALEFARRGAKVCVAARSESGLFSLVEEIYADEKVRRNGGEAFAVVADAANFDEVKKVADETVKTFGRLNTWIHAAAAFLFAPFEKIEPEEFKRMVEVNLLGQVYGAMVALPHLRENGGALLHVTSVEAWRAVPFQSAYGASKHGVKGFLQVLRVELQAANVPVVVTEIQPAAINTPIYDKGRSKMEFLPRPVPPIYQPNVVTDAILYAAENPTREIIAGSAGLGVKFFEKLSPRLTDKLAGTIGIIGQKSTIPKEANRRDSLFETIEEFDTTRGRFDSESLSFDPYTYLRTHKKPRAVLLIAAVALLGGLAARRLRLARNDKTHAQK